MCKLFSIRIYVYILFSIRIYTVLNSYTYCSQFVPHVELDNDIVPYKRQIAKGVSHTADYKANMVEVPL